MDGLIKNLLIILLFWCFDISADSCKNSKTVSTKLEKKLVGNNLSILLPAYYKVEETLGPDFTVYYFEPEDSTMGGIGSAGIYFGGHPHKPRDTILCTIESVNKKLLSSTVTWSIYYCEGEKSVTAETFVTLGDYDKIHAFTYCNSRRDNDSLINLFATLKEK